MWMLVRWVLRELLIDNESCKNSVFLFLTSTIATSVCVPDTRRSLQYLVFVSYESIRCFLYVVPVFWRDCRIRQSDLETALPVSATSPWPLYALRFYNNALFFSKLITLQRKLYDVCNKQVASTQWEALCKNDVTQRKIYFHSYHSVSWWTHSAWES
jgi:hypothetical protein